MQWPGTGAFRTQILPSQQKQEITKITNSQNTKRTYGQPSGPLIPYFVFYRLSYNYFHLGFEGRALKILSLVKLLLIWPGDYNGTLTLRKT